MCAVGDDVSAVSADIGHAQLDVMINAEHLGHGVVGHGGEHNVLASHVAMDVRLVKLGNHRREESVLLIGGTVSVRHVLRVDAAREVAFRRRKLHAFIIGIVESGHGHLH